MLRAHANFHMAKYVPPGRRVVYMQPLSEHDYNFLTNRIAETFAKDVDLHERTIEAAALWRIMPLRSPYVNAAWFTEYAFINGAFTPREWLAALFCTETTSLETVQMLLDCLRVPGDARTCFSACCRAMLRNLIFELQRCVKERTAFCRKRFYYSIALRSYRMY